MLIHWPIIWLCIQPLIFFQPISKELITKQQYLFGDSLPRYFFIVLQAIIPLVELLRSAPDIVVIVRQSIYQGAVITFEQVHCFAFVSQPAFELLVFDIVLLVHEIGALGVAEFEVVGTYGLVDDCEDVHILVVVEFIA